MITMSKKESMDYFPEMTIKILEENFSRVDISEMEKNLKKKIYEHNRENIRKIVQILDLLQRIKLKMMKLKYIYLM